VTSAQRGWAVSAVNGVLALGLVLALAAFALVVDPPAPPGIAEFAPQATKPIARAPRGQGGGHGAAGGPCAADGACGPSTSATGVVAAPTPVPTRSGGVASTKQCYAWSDGSITQTWDPQSPPCIADWPERARGNGSATARGVSRTEIRVTVPWDVSYDERQPLVDFFNTRFELYGRRLVLVPFQPQSGNANNGASDPPAQRADAEAAKSFEPFASMTYPGGQSNTKTLVDRLTTAGIVTVTAASQVTIGFESELQRQAPYAWHYAPTSDDLFQATATMTCRQLVGRAAAHSLDYRTTKRTFAIVVPDEEYLGGHLDGLEHLQDTLAACGVPRPRVVQYKQPLSTSDPSPIISAMLQLKSEGITSLIFWPMLSGAGAPGAPQKAASSANYHPEWIITGYSAGSAFGLGAGSPEQVRSSFGVASWNKFETIAQRPYYRAYLEATGRTPPEIVSLQGDTYESLYRSLLVIASGVQMAGAQLTPQRFEEAMQEATFPNPGAGARPSYQAHVGFADDHVMVDDYAAFWFNPTRPYNPGDESSDPFCSVESGRRWSGRAWPSGPDPFRPGEACR